MILMIYSTLYERVTNDFRQYAQHLLGYPDIFCSLVSAEYLFAQYVKNKKPNEQFDYSCISILYYLALEDFLNKLLYTSYSIDVLDKNAPLVSQNFVPFISHSKKFWDSKNRSYKKTCEIGNLGHLFIALPQETEYEKHLKHLYPNIDIQQLIQFGNKLLSVAPRRNEAAHGGKLITYSDVCIDKEKIYDVPNPVYRGLIMELFKIIFS